MQAGATRAVRTLRIRDGSATLTEVAQGSTGAALCTRPDRPQKLLDLDLASGLHDGVVTSYLHPVTVLRARCLEDERGELLRLRKENSAVKVEREILRRTRRNRPRHDQLCDDRPRAAAMARHFVSHRRSARSRRRWRRSRSNSSFVFTSTSVYGRPRRRVS